MPNNLWTPTTNWNAGTDFTEVKAEAELTDNLYTLWLALTGDLSGSGAGKVPHLHLTGTLGARPAAGNAGRFYRTTDNPKRIYFDDGATWMIVGGDDSLAHVQRLSDQTIPDSTATDIIFTGIRYDNDGMWPGAGPNAHKLVINTPGVYDFFGNVEWEASVAVGLRQVWISKNNAVSIGSTRLENVGPSGPQQCVFGRSKCSAGDYVTLRVEQISGGPLVIQDFNDYTPEFSAHRIGTG